MNIGYDFDGVITLNVYDTNILGERHEKQNEISSPNYMIIDQIKEQLKSEAKLFIISKNTKERIQNKLKKELFLSYLFDDSNIIAGLDSKVDTIKKLKIDKFYDDSVDNIHEINTVVRKQQLIPLELFLVKPETEEIIEIKNDNYRVLTYNTNWKNMFGEKDAPNPLCRKKNDKEKNGICASNVVNLIKSQLPLDFIFIQEAITSEFDILKDSYEFIITQSGPEKLHTIINKKYGIPLKIIYGEFEKGRPFHIIILQEKLCLINVHFGHQKILKSELKKIQYKFEEYYDKKLIKKMRIIMAGDFNMNIKELPTFLGKKYRKSKTKGTCCISSQKFNFVDKSALREIYNLKNIDHIFDSSDDIVYSLTIFPFDDNRLLLPASDHLPVFAELKK
jgi:uncharacterized HAD superfamily protein